MVTPTMGGPVSPSIIWSVTLFFDLFDPAIDGADMLLPPTGADCGRWRLLCRELALDPRLESVYRLHAVVGRGPRPIRSQVLERIGLVDL